jgi:ElaB/YqjD/DUF883 family membrane-anchored ribosome-binding protein
MADPIATLKDAAYVTVGLGVLGFQKAQVRRVELSKQLAEQTKALESQFQDASKSFRTLAQDLDARIAPARQRVEGRLDALSVRLPEQARTLVEQARAAAKQTETQLRGTLGLSASAA